MDSSGSEERPMPALLGYILAVAIFLGGGYGALSWLAEPQEPTNVAMKARHAPRPGTYGAATTSQDPQRESATDASGKADTINPPAANTTTAAADPDKRYDAMARAEPAVEKSAAKPVSAAKPAAAKAVVATAVPEPAAASASIRPETKPEADRPPVAKATGTDRSLQPKRQRVRQAEERRHPRYEVMTLRTI
jgi:hypothetical protein